MDQKILNEVMKEAEWEEANALVKEHKWFYFVMLCLVVEILILVYLKSIGMIK